MSAWYWFALNPTLFNFTYAICVCLWIWTYTMKEFSFVQRKNIRADVFNTLEFRDFASSKRVKRYDDVRKTAHEAISMMSFLSSACATLLVYRCSRRSRICWMTITAIFWFSESLTSIILETLQYRRCCKCRMQLETLLSKLKNSFYIDLFRESCDLQTIETKDMFPLRDAICLIYDCETNLRCWVVQDSNSDWDSSFSIDCEFLVMTLCFVLSSKSLQQRLALSI